jgi:hypothetical protein
MRKRKTKLPPGAYAGIVAGLRLGILENVKMVDGAWYRRMKPEYAKLGTPDNWPPELVSRVNALVEGLMRDHTEQELEDMANAGGEPNLSMNRQ